MQPKIRLYLPSALSSVFHHSIPANNLQVFVPYSRYREELGEDHLLRLTATLKDEDSFYIYFAQEEISICDPPLTIEVRSAYHSVTAVEKTAFIVINSKKNLLG